MKAGGWELKEANVDAWELEEGKRGQNVRLRGRRSRGVQFCLKLTLLLVTCYLLECLKQSSPPDPPHQSEEKPP